MYINNPDGGYLVLNSYNPTRGEVVSRKNTQLGGVTSQTAIGYITEAATKYAPGRTIANVPTARERYPGLIGRPLTGRVYLEVPVQRLPVPRVVLDAANDARVIIRDINGHEY